MIWITVKFGREYNHGLWDHVYRCVRACVHCVRAVRARVGAQLIVLGERRTQRAHTHTHTPSHTHTPGLHLYPVVIPTQSLQFNLYLLPQVLNSLSIYLCIYPYLVFLLFLSHSPFSFPLSSFLFCHFKSFSFSFQKYYFLLL